MPTFFQPTPAFHARNNHDIKEHQISLYKRAKKKTQTRDTRTQRKNHGHQYQCQHTMPPDQKEDTVYSARFGSASTISSSEVSLWPGTDETDKNHGSIVGISPSRDGLAAQAHSTAWKERPHVLVAFLAVILFIFQFGNVLGSVPSTRLLESIICRENFGKHTSANSISSVSMLDESMCQVGPVQTELNIVSTGLAVFGCVPGTYLYYSPCHRPRRRLVVPFL